jgi:putative ABC transport system permease protein
MGLVVPLARRNLLTEKVRLTMSIAGVAFAVLLVLVVASLYRGWSASSTFFSDLPGDVWVSQPGTSDPLRGSSFLPEDDLAVLRDLDGVGLVIPVYSRRVAIPGDGRELSVEFMAFDAPAGPIPGQDGQSPFLPPVGEVTIDRVLADELGVDQGDELVVLGRPLVVAQVTEGGNPLFELAFLNAEDARELIGLRGYVNFYVLALAPGAAVDDVRSAVAAALPAAESRTSDEYAAGMAATVDEGFLPVVGALVAIGLAIGGAVVALTTYTATIEKARDFAVLKALGASGWFLYRVVIRQSVIVGVVGSVLGAGSAAVVAAFVRRAVPEFVTDLQRLDVLLVISATVAVSLVAAYVPVRRINRIDPAMVFRA